MIGHFPCPCPLQSFFLDNSQVSHNDFQPILLFRYRNVYVSLLLLCTLFSFDTVKIYFILCLIFFFFFILQFFKKFKMTDIHYWDFYVSRDFSVEHTEMDFCIKFQVNQCCSGKGMAFQKLPFWALITAPPSCQFQRQFVCKVCM